MKNHRRENLKTHTSPLCVHLVHFTNRKHKNYYMYVLAAWRETIPQTIVFLYSRDAFRADADEGGTSISAIGIRIQRV